MNRTNQPNSLKESRPGGKSTTNVLHIGQTVRPISRTEPRDGSTITGPCMSPPSLPNSRTGPGVDASTIDMTNMLFSTLSIVQPVINDPRTSQTNLPNWPTEPQGKDLTGQVKVLKAPGQEYDWCVACGGSTDVLKGTYNNTFVAVKRFRGSIDDPMTDTINRRLVRESVVWLRVEHENVQPYLGHCMGIAPFVALVSPFCKNGSIIKYLLTKPSTNRLALVKDVAKGLHYLHSENIVHADIHPGNVLISDHGHAMLTDFGRAKVLGELGFDTKAVAGSAAYMAPELTPGGDDNVNVDKMFSKESDVYAYAMLCQKVFTGKAPFAGYNPQNDQQITILVWQHKRPIRTDQIPKMLWDIMESCWVVSPKERPSTEEILKLMGQ